MEHANFVGIDISKDTLDLVLLKQDGQIISLVCQNDEASFKEVLIKIFKEPNVTPSNTLFCAEHTGHFGKKLIRVALAQGLYLWYESAMKIHAAQGLTRGKDDKIDAIRIAQYAKRYSDQAKPLVPESETIEIIKSLSTERELLVKDRGKFVGQIKQEEGFLNKKYMTAKKKRMNKLIKQLTEAISEIEAQIEKLIDADPLIKENFKSMISILGIGKETALATIVATENFMKFDDPKKFVCHAGCAPFKYFSGTSKRSSNKVSKKANRKLKTLFHMAAMSCIKAKGEMREYYLRKVAEGKNKTLVLNNVAAKLIGRIFAVVKDGRKYEKIYNKSFA
jgi:transposase